jgi:predicted amidophosphoribosyltransferase
MNIKELKDRALFALSVPKCICCQQRLDYGQKAFCAKCSDSLEEYLPRNCSRCAKPLIQCSCSNNFLETHFVKRVIKCYRYKSNDDASASSRLIFSLKRDNRRDVLDRASEMLVEAINNSIDNPSEYIITNIPRRESAIVEYGFDHSALLAKEIARKSGAEYVSFFKSKAKRAQKSLDSIERRKNADFVLINERDLSKRRVIIVDDIITSGASMSNAATLLRSLNCHDITAAALAIAYKDD